MMPKCHNYILILLDFQHIVNIVCFHSGRYCELLCVYMEYKSGEVIMCNNGMGDGNALFHIFPHSSCHLDYDVI